MRTQISTLDGTEFDVAVIGAGVNGCSAAQHLAAEGYSVLLIDQGDIASGSSSRSSRLLHCGLRYLAPGASMWEFVSHPARFVTACRMARQGMESRSQMVRETPERVRPMTFYYPIYDETPYAPWQLDVAFKLLKALGPKDVPLDYQRIARKAVPGMPLLSALRDPEKLRTVVSFREYRFEWPERVALDTALDAARLGAVVRNYTALDGMSRKGERWTLRLKDALDGGQASVSVHTVLNTAGIWIDRVNGMAEASPNRRITGTKGIHAMVQLPPECADLGIATMNRVDEPFYCVPWRGLHYFGPTETLYDGDIDDIRAEEDEIAWLLAEANHLLPGLGVTRNDVLFTWAGVRPLTYDPAQPKGARSRKIHDLAGEGMPNVLALTAGPIMTHRSAGEQLTERVRKHIKPSGHKQTLSYAAKLHPENTNAPAVDDAWPDAKMAHLAYAAAHEWPTNLVDLLFRRTGNGWTASMGAAAAEDAAREIAPVLGWDEARIKAEAQGYRDYLKRMHNHAG